MNRIQFQTQVLKVVLSNLKKLPNIRLFRYGVTRTRAIRLLGRKVRHVLCLTSGESYTQSATFPTKKHAARRLVGFWLNEHLNRLGMAQKMDGTGGQTVGARLEDDHQIALLRLGQFHTFSQKV